MDSKPITAAPVARAVFTIAVAALVGAAACTRNRTPERVQPAPGEGIVLNDAEVTGTAITVNQGQVRLGQLALSKSHTEAVREFAQRMVTDHTDANRMLVDVANEEDFRPEDTSTSNEFEASIARTADALRDMRGRGFDRAYIENQIDIHRWILETLDGTLIPAADEEDLERGLMEYRAVIEMHLDYARQVHSVID